MAYGPVAGRCPGTATAAPEFAQQIVNGYGSTSTARSYCCTVYCTPTPQDSQIQICPKRNKNSNN